MSRTPTGNVAPLSLGDDDDLESTDRSNADRDVATS